MAGDGPMGEEATPSVRHAREAARVLLVLSAILALVAGGLALGLTLLGGEPCPSYPSCVLQPSGSVLAAHATVSAVLGVTVLLTFGLAVLLRKSDPGVLWLSLVTLGLLVVMAGIGMGLATGALPDVFLYVQTVFLAVLLALLYLTWKALRAGGAPRPASHPGELGTEA